MIKWLIGIFAVMALTSPSLAADGKSGYFLHIQKQAESGHAWAEKSVGDAYYFGVGVETDPKKSVVWYRKAAEQGFADAQYTLGRAYYFGEGVNRDVNNAVKYYQKAAEQGHSDAQYALGRMYYLGIGIDEDNKKAAKWYKESGNKDALYDLGEMYLSGEGVDRDLIEAYSNFLQGSYWGSKEAEQALHTIRWSDDLTPFEIKDVQEEFTKYLQDESSYEVESISVYIAVADADSEPLSAEKVYEHIWRSVVYVDTDYASGSGVIILPNIVATNCHVIEGAGDITVYKYVDSKAQKFIGYEASPHNNNESHVYKDQDFCLLYVENLWGEPATIRRYDTLKHGERVYALGAPHGEDLSFSTGIISQLRNGEIQTDADIASGSSGGGLFDSTGNLIGLTTYGLIDPEIGSDVEGLEYAIPADIALYF